MKAPQNILFVLHKQRISRSLSDRTLECRPLYPFFGSHVYFQSSSGLSPENPLDDERRLE